MMSDSYGDLASEEGQFEYEEGESELLDSGEGSEAPQLAPIEETTKPADSAPKPEEFESDPESDISSSSIDSEELESEDDGFMYAHKLDTYIRNKAEKRAEKEEQEKEKFKAKKRDKKGGSTNIEKLKQKPMSMVLPKRMTDRNATRDDKKTKKDLKFQNGR